MKTKNWLTSVVAGGLLLGCVGNMSASDFKTTVPGVKMRHMGPGNGGAMFGIGFKPDNPNVIIFGGDMGATYRTEDGGKSWQVLGGKGGINQPHSTYNVKFNPKQPNLVWVAGGSGVCRSTDAGKTWKYMQTEPRTCDAIGLDPDNPKVVYISEGQTPRFSLNWTHGLVAKTVDGGKTWRTIARPGGPVDSDSLKHRNYTDIIVDPNSKVITGQGHARVYIFGRGGLYRSDDAGKSWKDLSKSFAPGQINDMCLVNLKGKSILFLSAAPAVGLKKGGVYKSVDGGETWIAVNKGLRSIIHNLKIRNKSLAKNRNAAIFTLMLAHSPNKPKRLYAGSWQGIARSDDLGKTWHRILPRESSYVQTKDPHYRYVPALKNNRHYKKSLWGGIDSFHCLVAAPSNADIVAFSDNQGLYRTTDSGKIWDDITFDFGKIFAPNALQGKKLPPNRYTTRTRSRGVQNIVSDQIAIDPFNAKTYYAAYMDLGLEISRDGGEYWEHPTNGLPMRGHAWAVAVDPAKKGRVWVSVGQKWGQYGGIFQSNDSGKTWQRIGLKDASMGVIRDIAIDLHSPVNSRTIYLATEKKGIYKSSDGGKTWQNVTAGLPKTYQDSYQVKLTPDGKKLYAGTKAGLLVSKNGGRSWQLLKQQLFERVKGFSICKSHPDTIYVVANLPKNSYYWGKCHLFRTTNGGKSWHDITPAYMKYAGGIAVNPYDPNYIYACTNLSTMHDDEKVVIIRSKDGGKHWQDIGNGIGFSRGVNITLDPKNPQHLFVHARFSLIEIIDSQAPAK